MAQRHEEGSGAGSGCMTLKRVTLFGAESTGKTTLGLALARHFNTVLCLEYGRLYTQIHGREAATAADMMEIAKGHLASRHEAEKHASRILIEDTDPVLTQVWSDVLAGSHDPWFDAFEDYPDLYLFCDIDLPWVKDDVRYFSNPHDRQLFHDTCEHELITRGVNFVRISGAPEQRRATAVAAVEKLLKR
jgi:NadR type nicotinamide-nucleotide adenylyltransferase